MFTNNSSLSPSDVALLAGNNNNGFGFDGGGGAWVWLLIILFALGGWGGGFGWNGNGGGTASSVMDNYVLTSDFASLERDIDTVNSNVCNGLYTLQGLANGINQNVSNTGFGIQNAITQDTIANMQNTFGISTQINSLGSDLQQCCCDNRAQIADLKYTIATEECATRQTIADGTKAIIDKINADRMQELEDQNQALRLSASQQAQNQYLVNALRPLPVPAYPVSNPYYYGGFGGYGFNGYGTTIA